jgi:hypothetical protein
MPSPYRTVLAVCVLVALAPAGRAGDAIHLDQGWTADDRAAYYALPQGSEVMPYTWFLALEDTGAFEGGYKFDTARPGFSNRGHTYGTTISDEDRWALIEFLKTL